MRKAKNFSSMSNEYFLLLDNFAFFLLEKKKIKNKTEEENIRDKKKVDHKSLRKKFIQAKINKNTQIEMKTLSSKLINLNFDILELLVKSFVLNFF